MASIEASINKRAAKIRSLEKRVNELEDEIFREFCQSIGVDNIRYVDGDAKVPEWVRPTIEWAWLVMLWWTLNRELCPRAKALFAIVLIS